MGRLDDKIALVTGAAGSIGAASARLLVAEGARVVISDLDADRLDALVAELGEESAAALVADVTDSDAVAATVALAVERFGGLDVAFANAGIFGVPAPIVDYPVDVFDQVMAVNVRGPFLVAKHAMASMRDGGSLIFTSSVVGLTSDAGICAYATSKHALVGLMRTAAKEGAPRRIRVNTIHPGPVDNEFQHSIEERATGQSRDKAAEIFEGMIPLGRHATAEEVAHLVLYLAADESAFVTGAALPIDGGMSA
ncbi:MAG: short-chain dehydrogenase/reductase [Solirubrobacterales bacterium]|jgi:NAD(P)-dependent dehydrogenase (short-subunit alcohol dehydrogenase family)|nr:short-chain dehydrogenase/reductase [Solirubrobacterales bacterium]